MERNKKKREQPLYSTDGGYRLVAQLNRKRTATEKTENSTLSLEKTKDLCKALMQIFQKIIQLTTIREQNKEK